MAVWGAIIGGVSALAGGITQAISGNSIADTQLKAAETQAKGQVDAAKIQSEGQLAAIKETNQGNINLLDLQQLGFREQFNLSLFSKSLDQSLANSANSDKDLEYMIALQNGTQRKSSGVGTGTIILIIIVILAIVGGLVWWFKFRKKNN